MGRQSSGSWFQEVRRVAQTIGPKPTGPQLTAALMSDRAARSLAMARRLSSAYIYSTSKTSHDVVGSLAVIEQLQTIERLDPSAIAEVVEAALMGQVPLSALTARAASTRARLSAASSDTTMPEDLVEVCPEWQEPGLHCNHVELNPRRDRDLVIVDAALYDVEPLEVADRVRMSVDGRWCLLVSPHIGCAVVRDVSHDKFLMRILVAAALFARVSVVCSSPYERDLIDAALRRPRLKNRVWVRLIDSDSVMSK